jgi:2',3'-cyclic-nucleotide 2'-phosphodiesterase (5'-nucleotidase family)
VILLDAGGMFLWPDNAAARIKNDALLAGVARMKVAIANAGFSDAPALASFRSLPKTPVFISANLADRQNKLALAPYVLRNGMAFVGLSTAPSPPDARFPVEAPAAALRRVLPEARRKAASVVVLAYMPNYEALALAEKFPEIDALVMSYDLMSAIAPMQRGRAWLLSAEYEGKSVGFAGLHLGPDGRLKDLVAPGFRSLDAKIADDPAMAAVVAKAKARLAKSGS